MIELIRGILTSDAGSFAFVVSLMLLAFWLVYFITRKVTLMNADHSTLAKSVSGIEGTVDEMRRDLAYLKGSLDILKAPEQLLKAHSPISLTDEGKRVAGELGAEAMISRNWQHVLAIMDVDLAGKTPYDIQQYCLEEVSVQPERFFLKEDLDTIKKYAYSHGRPVELYTRMIGILIRDAYLKYRDIDISEVDKANH